MRQYEFHKAYYVYTKCVINVQLLSYSYCYYETVSKTDNTRTYVHM